MTPDHMSLLQVVVLALVQGITEYLPISSSGHLILIPALTGWPDQGVVTDMVTNLGTLAATIIYFWRDVVSMFQGLIDLVKRQKSYSATLVTNVIIGTIPILVVGFLMKKTGLSDHIRSPLLIGINAIVFGILLYAADAYGLFRNTLRELNWKNALIIGGAQALALSPGTSRSGITMTAGRALGFVRPEAARFSFLLSIPANAAASVFVIQSALKSGGHIGFDVMLCGVLTFFVGLGTIAFLMKMIRTQSFMPFVIYRVILGGALIGLIYSGMPFGKLN